MKILNTIKYLLVIIAIICIFFNWQISIILFIISTLLHVFPLGPNILFNVIIGELIILGVIFLFINWRIGVILIIGGFLISRFKIWGNKKNFEYYSKKKKEVKDKSDDYNKHKEFIEKYRSKNISIYPKHIKAIGLILSKHANWNYKPGIIFFSFISLLLLIVSVIGIIYSFINFKEGMLIFLISISGGYGFLSSTMKVSADLVKKEMIDNIEFYHYITNNKKDEVIISEK